MKLATVILAAGLGTRMKSGKAKVLHQLAGKALINYPVDISLALKADRTIAIVGHQSDKVAELLQNNYGKQVETAIQKEQLGTGHAVMSAEKALKKHKGLVLILSGDVPLLTKSTVAKLIKKVKQKKSPFGLVSAVLENPEGYGRVLRDSKNKIQAIVENRDATSEQKLICEANMGIYVADAKFLFNQLKKVGTDNDQGEYYLPDLVRMAYESGAGVVGIKADPAETLGINNRVQLAELGQILRQRILEKLMLKGVTIIDPQSTYIDADVKIKADTTIEPNCHIKGNTKIGSNCTIGTGSIIESATIGNDVQVKPYTIIEESKVDQGAILGPYSHLRPMSHIGSECHVGNFVETKKTTLKPGAKANHLSYLGDAVIGKKTNIGAGTITCNYDGYNKFATTIGDEVLVGSDTQLIAPISIPDRVVLGAGTSLANAEGVEKGDLVITRPEVVVVKGFRDKLENSAKKKKKKSTKK